MKRYALSHRTRYQYSQPVSLSRHLLHLSPRPVPHQACRRHQLKISPPPSITSDGTDFFGNPIRYATFQDNHSRIDILAESLIDVQSRPTLDVNSTTPWEDVPQMIAGDLSIEGLGISQFCYASRMTIADTNLVADITRFFTPGRPVLEAAMDLMGHIFATYEYDGTATTVSTPVDEVIRIKRGVCQDFAHLQIACLRALGLAARYVSGYLLTHPPEGQEKLVGADASHAWLSLWVPEYGWVDLDPTNNIIPGDEHITLAWGRDYADVSPINGVIFGGGQHTVHVEVDVNPT
ncbi:MAG: transglutaminase family protein [Pseudomonadota bacterium]